MSFGEINIEWNKFKCLIHKKIVDYVFREWEIMKLGWTLQVLLYWQPSGACLIPQCFLGVKMYHLHSIPKYACLTKPLWHNQSNPPLIGQDISLSDTCGKVAYRQTSNINESSKWQTYPPAKLSPKLAQIISFQPTFRNVHNIKETIWMTVWLQLALTSQSSCQGEREDVFYGLIKYR